MLELGQYVGIEESPMSGSVSFDRTDLHTEDWICGIRKVNGRYHYQLHNQPWNCWWLEHELEAYTTYEMDDYNPYVEPQYAIGDRVILVDTPYPARNITAVIYDDGFEYQLDNGSSYVCERRLARHEDTAYTLF